MASKDGRLLNPEKEEDSVTLSANPWQSYIVYHIFFFRIQSKRNVNMGELLTPERLALLVSVAVLATISIASVLTILLCTR